MKHLLLDTWFDAITEQWTVTVWLLDGETFEPETDRFYTLEKRHEDRSIALEHARDVAKALRQAGYDVELLPVRPRWLEDSAEEVTAAIDGRLAAFEAFDRSMAEALLNVVPAAQRLRVVTALEGRL